MEDTNKTRRLLFIREDGTRTEGTADDMMRAFHDAGGKGTLHEHVDYNVKHNALPRVVEDTEDEATEDATPREVVAVTPSATVGQVDFHPGLAGDPNEYTYGRALRAERDDAKHDPVTVSSLADMRERREAYADESTAGQWSQVEVHEEDEATAEADAKMLRDMGLTPGRTWYAPGTPLNSWGVDKWKAERQALDDAPRAVDACRAIEDAVRQEDREDYELEEPHRLRLEVDGDALVLTHPDIKPARLERQGLRGLMSRYGRKAAHDWSAILPPWSYMETMRRDELAEHFNQRAPRVLADRPGLLLRTRSAVDGGGRSVFGVVSPSYGVCDVDQVARILREELPADVAAAMVYDPDNASMTFEATSMRDVPPTVGEVWKVGLKGGTGDNGGTGGSFRNFGGFWRVVCRNLTTEELEAVERLRQRHRGDGVAGKIREQIRAGWAALRPAFDQFAGRWEVLNRTAAVDMFGGADMTEAIAEMVAKTTHGKELVKASEVSRDALVQMLLHTHSAEPGETVADVVNAVTRLHESRLPAHRIAAVESVAGDMARSWAGGQA